MNVFRKKLKFPVSLIFGYMAVGQWSDKHAYECKWRLRVSSKKLASTKLRSNINSLQQLTKLSLMRLTIDYSLTNARNAMNTSTIYYLTRSYGGSQTENILFKQYLVEHSVAWYKIWPYSNTANLLTIWR